MGYWELDGGWIGDDSKYEEEFPLDDGSRWLVGAKHNGHFGDNWYTRINYTRVSDTEYLRDLNNSNLSAQRETALQQLARLAWINDQWQVTLDFEQFQSIAEDIPEDYRKLPQMTARWVGNREWLGLTPLFLSQLSYFDSDVDRVTGQRVYSEFGLTKPMNWTAGFFTPTVKYRAVNYELDRPSSNIETSPNAGSLMTSLDGGLIFERQTSLFGQSMTQTLEPRAYYLYSQYEEQRYQPSFDSAELTFGYGQLFRDTRFSGNDRLDDANQLSIGVTSRYFDNETGEEKLSASLGQIYYFRDREIRLSPGDPALAEATSPLAGEFTWSPTQQWKLRASALYDPNDNTFDAASAQATYFPSSGAVLSAGYTLREPPPSLLERPVTEQANVSAYVPLNDDWSLFGALEYSLEGSTAVEDMVGFEFDNCCWRIRILYMRYIDTERGEIPNFSDPDLDRENAIQVQFLLKGMGGFGGRVDNLLGDMIRGFAER
jgi:LPS-assembly protein